MIKISTGLFLVILCNYPAACEFRAVHITMGDIAVQNAASDHVYTIGFMSTTQCELDHLKVHLILDKNLESSEEFLHERIYEAPANSGVEYKRFFYFVHVHKTTLKDNLCSFRYFLSNGHVASKTFEFQSQAMCGSGHRFFVLGNHDYSKFGLITMESLYKEEFDGLIMGGNYVSHYHSENGLAGDRYFEKMEPILASRIFVVLPGYNEMFDDYKMFNSRFRMPGCDYEDLHCDVFGVGDNVVTMIMINLERTLFNPTMDRKALLLKTKELFEALNVNDTGEPNWRLVVSNVPFGCSGYEGLYPCNTVMYYIKPFDDLFEQYKANLIINTVKRFYEAVKNIFNYQIRNSNIKQIISAGAPGHTNFFLRPPLNKAAFSYFISNEEQGVLELNIFDTYCKSDFLLVPSMISTDLAYTERNELHSDWLLLVFCTLLFVLVVLMLEYVKSNKLAAYFIDKKKQGDVEGQRLNQTG
jgi:hypothetical protein